MFLLNIQLDLNVKFSQTQQLLEKENGIVVTQTIFQDEIKDENWLWHLRFGNLNFGGLNLLNKKNMVKRLPPINQPTRICEGYILGNKHRE